MIKKKFLFLMVVAAGIAIASSCYFSVDVVRDMFIMVGKPSIVTTINAGDDVFHIVPEKALDGAIIVDAKGEKHYVFSEKKLRLIGPKFLAEMAGEK